MANNRMYIRCKRCGAIFFLGKCCGDGYYYDNYHKVKGSLEDQLNEFLDEHAYCEHSREEFKDDINYIDTPLPDEEDVWEENQFEICYEFERKTREDDD